MSPLQAWGIRVLRHPQRHLPSGGSHPDGSITEVAPAPSATVREIGPPLPSASHPKTAGVMSGPLQCPGTVLEPPAFSHMHHTAPVIARLEPQLPHTAAAISGMSILQNMGMRALYLSQSHLPGGGSHPEGSVAKVAPAPPPTATGSGPKPPSASIPRTAGMISGHLQGPATLLHPVPAPSSQSATARPLGAGIQRSEDPISTASVVYRGRVIHAADMRRQILQPPASNIVAAPNAKASEASPILMPNVPVSAAEQGSSRVHGEYHGAEMLVSSRGL